MKLMKAALALAHEGDKDKVEEGCICIASSLMDALADKLGEGHWLVKGSLGPFTMEARVYVQFPCEDAVNPYEIALATYVKMAGVYNEVRTKDYYIYFPDEPLPSPRVLFYYALLLALLEEGEVEIEEIKEE